VSALPPDSLFLPPLLEAFAECSDLRRPLLGHALVFERLGLLVVQRVSGWLLGFDPSEDALRTAGSSSSGDSNIPFAASSKTDGMYSVITLSPY
jgi:hypothetical protein